MGFRDWLQAWFREHPPEAAAAPNHPHLSGSLGHLIKEASNDDLCVDALVNEARQQLLEDQTRRFIRMLSTPDPVAPDTDFLKYAYQALRNIGVKDRVPEMFKNAVFNMLEHRLLEGKDVALFESMSSSEIFDAYIITIVKFARDELKDKTDPHYWARRKDGEDRGI